MVSSSSSPCHMEAGKEMQSTNGNRFGRQLGHGEGAVQTQPSAKELRRDGEDHALPQLDMSVG